MFVEGVRLNVELGSPALEAIEANGAIKELSGINSLISSVTSLFREIAAASKDKKTTCERESEAFLYAHRELANLETLCTFGQILNEFQTVYWNIIEEERVARVRLDALYADIKQLIATRRVAEYFMSSDCVMQRFLLEEEARETITALLQDYSSYMSALRYLEEDEREVAVQRAKARRQNLPHQTAQENNTQSVYQPSVATSSFYSSIPVDDTVGFYDARPQPWPQQVMQNSQSAFVPAIPQQFPQQACPSGFYSHVSSTWAQPHEQGPFPGHPRPPPPLPQQFPPHAQQTQTSFFGNAGGPQNRPGNFYFQGL